MFFTEFNILISDGPVRIIPVNSGKILNFRKVFMHGRNIAIRTGRPVIGYNITFIKKTFDTVDAFKIFMKIIIGILKLYITDNQ